LRLHVFASLKNYLLEFARLSPQVECWLARRVDWDERLFALLDDLEGQAEALYAVDREAELADRGRAEYASVPFATRLMASVDRELVLDLAGIGRVEGRLRRVAAEWCLLNGRAGDWVVPAGAITAAQGLSARSVPQVAWSPLTRLGLGSALRRLAEEEVACVVHRRDGGRHEGVVRRVGADFLELEQGGRAVLVPFEGLAAVQSRQ
jgi:hypothetical protein